MLSGCAVTLAQADAVLTAAERTRMRAYVVLSLLTGARTEELRALTWDHVDLTGNPDANPPGTAAHGGVAVSPGRRRHQNPPSRSTWTGADLRSRLGESNPGPAHYEQSRATRWTGALLHSPPASASRRGRESPYTYGVVVTQFVTHVAGPGSPPAASGSQGPTQGCAGEVREISPAHPCGGLPGAPSGPASAPTGGLAARWAG